jgi:putative hydrolase of the HAD superfamily
LHSHVLATRRATIRPADGDHPRRGRGHRRSLRHRPAPLRGGASWRVALCCISLRLGDVQDRRAPAAVDQPQPPTATPRFRGLITDWGGVMTSPIADTVRAWLDYEGIDHDSYTAAIRPWLLAAYDPAKDGNPIHALERGECTIGDFERLLAPMLVRRDGGQVLAEGLLTRMFAASLPCEPMYAAVHAARAAGLRTCLLSNSWGSEAYPRDVLADMYHAVVISAEVGMRKPEERIFRHAAELLGLAPSECVFIDDIEPNVQVAEALGMYGVLHIEPEVSVAQLAELFGLPPG